jgi:hypothetical protein
MNTLIPNKKNSNLFFLWRCGPTRAMVSSFLWFVYYTWWRTTVDRTPLEEWSARRKDLYLRSHKTQTPMPPVRFETTISAGEWPQTYTLDRATTGTNHQPLSGWQDQTEWDVPGMQHVWQRLETHPNCNQKYTWATQFYSVQSFLRERQRFNRRNLPRSWQIRCTPSDIM